MTQHVEAVVASLEARKEKRKQEGTGAKPDTKTKTEAPAVPAKKAKAKAKAHSKERTIYDRNNRPPLIVPGTGAVWYGRGKVSCPQHGKALRVFLRSDDRCDIQVKVTDSLEAAWALALQKIDDAEDAA